MDSYQVQDYFEEVELDQLQGRFEYEGWHRRMWWRLCQVKVQHE